ncbi:MAG: ferrichrome ABC transporter ATP-binding protein [Citromicrobium sp.]|nr:ferrichrome ABC transporter ATP-binding protein [Citromicrobium sp.]
MMLEARDLALGERLRGVSARIEAGGITAICGPNGAGKSTLVRLLAGVIAPSGGEALLDGRNVHTMHPRTRARSLGYLPQEPKIAWDLSVRNLVSLGRLAHGDAREEPVEAALAAMGLEGFANRPVSTLSGGERARALLARVIAGEPRFILADEPFAALDLAYQASLARHLRVQAEERGRGVAVVVHDLTLAHRLADRVVLLHEGALYAQGTPEEVLAPGNLHAVFGIEAEWLGDARARVLSLR